MINQKNTKLAILIKILKDNYGDYYNNHIGHDFLDSVEYNIFDSITYLVEHIRKLNKEDKDYLSYLKHCYAIFIELQYIVRNELEEFSKQYIKLIQQYLITKSADRLLLLELSINNESEMKNFCKEVENDKKEIFSEVILNIIKDYDYFKSNKAIKIDEINLVNKKRPLRRSFLSIYIVFESKFSLCFSFCS